MAKTLRNCFGCIDCASCEIVAIAVGVFTAQIRSFAKDSNYCKGCKNCDRCSYCQECEFCQGCAYCQRCNFIQGYTAILNNMIPIIRPIF
ncbi:hypothetical protein [Helicobacter typhlonius]|uniref:hypothetical protein n=1 Tax=Helicobacter typhlonius TaxID=76936 RepID=UPI002FE1A73E